MTEYPGYTFFIQTAPSPVLPSSTLLSRYCRQTQQERGQAKMQAKRIAASQRIERSLSVDSVLSTLLFLSNPGGIWINANIAENAASILL
jgi:hypothetical protein